MSETASRDKTFVLLLGATGRTGESIVNGLLASSSGFRIAAAVRTSSLSKPATERLRAAGVEIREGDITDSFDKLKTMLQDVDVDISAVTAYMLDVQKELFRAAKEVGVKRIVPCDFATPGNKGVRVLHDMKLGIREFVKALDVPYTIIDVGWWMQLFLPHATTAPSPQDSKNATWQILDDATPRVLLINLDRIGVYVARIVADPRTLNKAEAHEIGEQASGEAEELKGKRIYVHSEDIVKRVKMAGEMVEADPTNPTALFTLSQAQYLHSMLVLEENTLKNAKKLGYLDVHELYPELNSERCRLQDYATKFYAQGGAYVYA